MIAECVLAWIPMVLIAILNGGLRELTYGKYMARLRAHQLSALTGIILFYLYTWFITLHWKLDSADQAIMVGIVWLLLTIAFEFLFGHYVAKHSWTRLLDDYNLLAGKLWSLVLIAVALAPYVFFRSRS